MYLEGNRHWVPLVCDYSSHYCLITAVKWPSSPGGGGGGALYEFIGGDVPQGPGNP